MKKKGHPRHYRLFLCVFKCFCVRVWRLTALRVVFFSVCVDWKMRATTDWWSTGGRQCVSGQPRRLLVVVVACLLLFVAPSPVDGKSQSSPAQVHSTFVHLMPCFLLLLFFFDSFLKEKNKKQSGDDDMWPSSLPH